jgi:hypothetical protein
MTQRNEYQLKHTSDLLTLRASRRGGLNAAAALVNFGTTVDGYWIDLDTVITDLLHATATCRGKEALVGAKVKPRTRRQKPPFQHLPNTM